MRNEEILEAMEDGRDAQELLAEKVPGAERRFRRLCTTMRKLLSDVQDEFPDAEYYTGGGGFNLLIGSSHGARDSSQHEMIAVSGGPGMHVSDGDW